jgi:hypothetical protein
MSTGKQLALFFAVAACVVTGFDALAEERTVNAYAPWEGRGQIYPTGVNQATFVGAFSGIMFVESEGKLVSTGNMICPGVIDINLDDGSQTGVGKCTLSNAEGERIFAEWTCVGTHFVGCDGTFRLVSGTGEYKGVSGEGNFLIRSGLHAAAASFGGNIVQRAASGLAIWRDFRFKIPD